MARASPIYAEVQPVRLSRKDMLILKELDKNARQSFSQIGKNIRLSKEVVNYRIKRMMDLGLVSNFNTIIDVTKLGWQMFSIYIRLKEIDAKTEEEIVKYFVAHPNVSWLKQCIGNYDLVLKLFAKDYEHLDDIMKKIEDDLKGHISELSRDMIVSEQFAPFSVVYPLFRKPKQTLISRDNVTVNVTDEDKTILKALASNARANIAELSQKTKIPVDTVRYRLKKLEESKVIMHYRPSVWPRIFGYGWFFIVLKVQSLSLPLKKRLEEMLLNRYNEITYLYRSIGNGDIQVEIRAKNTEHLNQILLDIRDVLKNVLKGHNTLIVLNEPKFTYFPECLSEE